MALQSLTRRQIDERSRETDFKIANANSSLLARSAIQCSPWRPSQPTLGHLPLHFIYPLSPSHSQLYSTRSPKPSDSLPHLTPTAEIHVISVSQKPITHRVALAIGHVEFSGPRTLELLQQNLLKKGDVLAVARIAGIRAIKHTGDVIPLAHNGICVEGAVVKVEPASGSSDTSLHISNADSSHSEREDIGPVNRGLDEAMQLTLPIGHNGGVRIAAQVETTAKTGVEMEALAGVMGAALTVVDMVKSVDRCVSIEGVKVVGKKGGRSGGWGVWAGEV